MTELYHTDQTLEPRNPRRKKQFPPAKPGHKYCFECEEEKPLDQFAIKKGVHFSYCYECSRKRDRKRSQFGIKKERQYAPRKSIKAIYTSDGYKVCPSCEQELLYEEFPMRNGKPIGSCIECTRAKDRERNRLRRPTNNPRKRQEDIPLPPKTLPTQQCPSCGETKPLPAFELLRHSCEERSLECRTCAEKRRRDSITQLSLFFKRCSDCDIEKPLSTDFYQRDGKYSSYCKQCESKHSQQWQQEHPEQVRNRLLKRQSDPAYIKYHREKQQKRYHTVPGVKLQYIEMSKRYKARKQGTRTEKVSYKHILERDGYYCYICCKDIDPSVKYGPGKLVFDHEIPLNPRLGEPQGTHTIDNIHPTHQICNARKSNKPFHSLTESNRQGL